MDLRPFMNLEGTEVEALPEFYFQVLLVALKRVQELPFKHMYEQIYKWLLEVVSGDELVEVQEFYENLPEVCEMSKMGLKEVDDLFRNVMALDDDDEEEEFMEEGAIGSVNKQHTVLIAE